MSNIETFRLLSHFSRVGLIGSVRYRILCKYKMGRSICNRFKVPKKSHFCIISIIRRQKGPMFQNFKVSILQSFESSAHSSLFQVIPIHSNSFQFIPSHSSSFKVGPHESRLVFILFGRLVHQQECLRFFATFWEAKMQLLRWNTIFLLEPPIVGRLPSQDLLHVGLRTR